MVVRTILRVSAAERVTADDRGEVGESLCRIQSQQSYAKALMIRQTYFSFNPPPTLAPLPWTVNVASSKDHELAARAAELKDRTETMEAWINFILACKEKFNGSSRRVLMV